VRFWVLDLIIAKRNVRVNRMIVGIYLKSVKKKKKNKIKNAIVAVYKELETSLKS
jgi:hypothetical protein